MREKVGRRERETDRQTDRDTERNRERSWKEGGRQRETETDGQTERERERCMWVVLAAVLDLSDFLISTIFRLVQEARAVRVKTDVETAISARRAII